MLLKNAIVGAICGSTFVSLPALGQENPMKPNTSVDVSVPFVENTNANGAQKSDCGKYGFVGGYRSFFNRYRGVEVRHAFRCNTPTYSLDKRLIGVKNKFDGGVVAHTSWFPANRWSPRNIAGPDTQPRFDYLHDRADYFNPTQPILPQSKHRGVFYNSATLNINGLRGFTDREQPAIVFGYIF
jgi:hypothetical protein